MNTAEDNPGNLEVSKISNFENKTETLNSVDKAESLDSLVKTETLNSIDKA